MTDQTKQSKRKEIAEAKKEFLGTGSLKNLHHGDPFFFEDIVLWGIRPMRLFADSIDNLMNENDDYEGACLLLNELQQKLDDVIEHLERWDSEARVSKGLKPLRKEGKLEKRKAPETEPSSKDSSGA